MRSDILWQIAGAILNRGAVLVSLIVLSHQISKAALGLYGYAVNYSATIAAVAATGVGIEVKKRLAQAGEDGARLSGGAVLIMGALVAVATMVGAAFFASAAETAAEGTAMAIIVCVLVASTTALNFVIFLAGGLSRFKFANLLQSGAAAVFLLALVVLPLEGAATALLLYTAYMTVQLVFLAATIGRSVMPAGFRLEWPDIRGILGKAMPTTIYAMSATPVFLLMQGIILGKAGASSVGEVINATQLTNVTNLVATQTLAVLFTQFAKLAASHPAAARRHEFSRLHKRYAAMLVVTVAGNLLAIPIFVALFAENALGDLRWVALLILGAGLNAYSWFYNEWLLAHGDVWFVAWCSIGWAAICLLTFTGLLATGTAPALCYAAGIIGARICMIPPLLLRLKRTIATT